jgi:D-xylose reductase
MPLVGFGLWKVNKDTCADQVYKSIKAGYRCFDGACGASCTSLSNPNAWWCFSSVVPSAVNVKCADYGNESEAGQGIARAIKEDVVKRDELFVVSKLWNTFHDGDKVEPICRRQLADWGIEYFDLFLIHFPVALKYIDPSVTYPPGWTGAEATPHFSNASTQETWTAMESLVDKKLTRSIGISNFSIQSIMDLLRYARIWPATLQVEHHPYLTQQRLVEYAQNQGIAVTAYSSFGPASFLELNMKGAQEAPLLFEHTTIKFISDKHGKTPAQVLLRWATQRGIAVIPKSNSPDHLEQNLNVTDWNLDDAEIESIGRLNRNLRFNDPLNVGVLHVNIA